MTEQFPDLSDRFWLAEDDYDSHDYESEYDPPFGYCLDCGAELWGENDDHSLDCLSPILQWRISHE